MRRALSTFVGLASLVAAAGGASGQTQQSVVRGRVIDATTRLPVEGAVIRRTSPPMQLLSNEGGLFSVRLSSPMAVDTLEIQRIGYRSVTVAVGAADSGPFVTVAVESMAVDLEGITVIVDGLERLLERRRNAATGVVTTFDTEALLEMNAAQGFDAFWKIVRIARPCHGSNPNYCLRAWGRDVPIVVCVDERRAWGGVLQLADYRPEDIYVLEVYLRGQVIRAYTNDWVKRHVVRRALPLDELNC